MTPRTLAGSRRPRREAYKPPTPHAEIWKAVGAVAGVLAVTGFCLWAMRPEGIFGRQPRVVLVIVVGIVVAASVGSYLAAPGRRFHHRSRAGWLVAVGVGLATTFAGVLVYNIVLDGVILHTQTPTVPDIAPTASIPDTTPPTTPAGQTLPTVPEVIPTAPPASSPSGTP